MDINEGNLSHSIDQYYKGIQNGNDANAVSSYVNEFFNHSDPLKEIFSYLVPNSCSTASMKYMRYYTGLENVNLVSKFFHKNANEVKKEWVQKELVSLKKMYELNTADEVVEFIIKNNLTRINLVHFLDFNATHLQKLIEANQNIISLKINCEQINEWPLMESLTSITPLNLSSKDIVAIVKACPNIQFINLDKQLNDEDLVELSKLQKLKTFKNGYSAKITDKGLEGLAKGCRMLETLDLSCSKVTGLSLVSYEKAFLKLKKLELYNTPLTDEGLNAIGENCPNLEEIIFTTTQVTDMGFAKLLKICPNIKIINLYNTLVTAKCLVNLANLGYKFPNVEKIIFDLKLSDEDLIALGKAFPNVTHLELSNRKITDQCLIGLLNAYPKVKTIDFSHTKITGESLKNLEQVFPNIESLYFFGTRLMDQGIIAFAKVCPNLKFINLGSRVTEKDLRELFTIFPNLKVQILASREVLASLKKDFPYVKFNS